MAANGTGHETPALELSDSHVVCRSHPKASAGVRELFLSLNGVDYGSTGVLYKYYSQLADLSLSPTGGLVGGGTLVTFIGHGFDAFFGALNDTLCRWGNATHSPVTAPVSIQPTTLICPTVAQPPGSVDVFIALNKIDYANLDLDFKYYVAPSFSSVSPTLGASSGGVRVTISGRGFLGFTEDASLGRCRFDHQPTRLLRLTDTEIVCSSATVPLNASAPTGAAATSKATELQLALNGADFSQVGLYRTFPERVNATGVAGGPAGGPSAGGTVLTIFGSGLSAVTHCKLGNGTAMPVLEANDTALTCRMTAIGDGTAVDGAAFLEGPREASASAAAAASFTQEALVLASYPTGYAPLLLSRGGAAALGGDGAAENDGGADAAAAGGDRGFFFTAQYFYLYPPPGNFSGILPRGGPLMKPTAVTLRGDGFLGFDGKAEQARCRWGGPEASGDVTTPTILTDSMLVCFSFARPTAGTVELFVSLNAGADFHATGQKFVFYPEPVMLRTGCLGAVKGCLTTGPTSGINPMKVTGIGLHGQRDGQGDGFVSYEEARCRFQDVSTGEYYYNRIATRLDVAEGGEVMGSGLKNGSITADGSSLYCVTPPAAVMQKIVTIVAVALNGVDFVAAADTSTSQYAYYPQSVFSISPVGGTFDEGTSVTVRGFFFPGFDGLKSSARCNFGGQLSIPTLLRVLTGAEAIDGVVNGEIVCASPTRSSSPFRSDAGGTGMEDVPFSVALNTVDFVGNENVTFRA